MFKKKLNNKKGFTLIELIVVIAIIGILSAVLVPKISGFTATAKTNADLSNKKMLYNVTSIAIANGDISIPALGGSNKIISSVAGTPTGAILWSSSGLEKYIDEWPDPKNGGNPFVITITNGTGAIAVTQP